MKHAPAPRALEILERALARKAKEHRKKVRYVIPSLWISSEGRARTVAVDPYRFYLGLVRKCRRAKAPAKRGATGGEWSREAVIYNMFVRTTTAVDHNGNGTLDLPLNPDGFRETGTFLKAMAMLPYLKRLGFTAIHLLPITAIGHDGNKGTLGSPYAIRNPYQIDESLSEPSLGLDVDTQFKAFVEAAHAMGFRVVAEFVFRTAAKDSDWVLEHPEWFYWIREEVPLRARGDFSEGAYGSPLFSREELDRIHHAVHSGNLSNLPPPHAQYREFFTAPPIRVEPAGGRYVGTLADQRKAKIPGAFADWPPDDNQPPWNDVTYLRMYTHPDFNYIGYNTIRMYDTRLTAPEHVNRPLWRKIVGIIPHYMDAFGIDGVMIDMGHALPRELKEEMIRTARKGNPDFAFWDENFAITAKSREEGYNVVFGYLWHVEHDRGLLREFLQRLEKETLPVPFFATAENHNTHRAASRHGAERFVRWSMLLNMFLPGVAFVHSGFEIAEEYPINTGLDFSGEELARMPSESLPLFSEFGYSWVRKTEQTALLQKVLKVRARYRAIITDQHHESFKVLPCANPAVMAYARLARTTKKRLAVVTNSSMTDSMVFDLHLDSRKGQVVDLVQGKKFKVREGLVHLSLGPGEGVVFEY